MDESLKRFIEYDSIPNPYEIAAFPQFAVLSIMERVLEITRFTFISENLDVYNDEIKNNSDDVSVASLRIIEQLEKLHHLSKTYRIMFAKEQYKNSKVDPADDIPF